MSVLRKMVLLYPDSYEKLIKRINVKSENIKEHDTDFERWMNIQQKLLQTKFKREYQKEVNKEKDEDITLKKIKLEEPSKREVATQVDDNDIIPRKLFFTPESTNVPKTPSTITTIFSNKSPETPSPMTLRSGKRKNQKGKSIIQWEMYD